MRVESDTKSVCPYGHTGRIISRDMSQKVGVE